MILEITAAAIGGGFVGYFACAAMTMGKVADQCGGECASIREQNDVLHEGIERWSDRAVQEAEAHARAADALATKQARIERALTCETPKAAHGVRKMAAILRGDA